jgi:uncharacterized protein (TIGR02246 family)
MSQISQVQAEERARAYTSAWCSHDPEAVASFYAEDGRITINDGESSNGRAEVAEMARGFMESFPDIVIQMDDLRSSGTHAVYRWTLEGHNTGPDRTGNYVRVSGWEYWRYNSEGLIAESYGHFDAEDYDRQLTGG